MVTTKVLQRVFIGLTLVLIILLAITFYRINKNLNDSSTDEIITTTDTNEFGGASSEELQTMLNALKPIDGSNGLSEEDMAGALADLREGEEGTEAEPDATPEGEMKPLTEAEIQARLQTLKEKPVDDGEGITPQ